MSCDIPAFVAKRNKPFALTLQQGLPWFTHIKLTLSPLSLVLWHLKILSEIPKFSMFKHHDDLMNSLNPIESMTESP